MFYFLLPLIVLLAGGINGQQYGQCDFSQDLLPDKEYYIYNPEYPQDYTYQTSCRWVLKSNLPIKISCDPFDVAPSSQCSKDAITIKQYGEKIGHRYCGRGNLNLLLKTPTLTITLSTSPETTGGKFLCVVKAQTPDDDNSDCKCGWKNAERIVGGQETGVNEFPMMAGVVELSRAFVYCGATIINDRQLLTAAHCVLNRDPSKIGILIGDHDLSKGSETNASKVLRVDTYDINPFYNNLTWENDIAIITVEKYIEFSQRVGPVCLPFQHSPDTFAGSPVEILGWGLTQPVDSVATVLQKAQVTVITNAACRRYHPRVTPAQMCTQEDDKDSCQFDSGGPVLWQNPSTRRLVEVGIIASGGPCANGEPVENTRVGAYIDWIVDLTPPGWEYCMIE
ncbi:venom serine protease 34-like [Venturia canescens]|uniref:venom serine protease 34-like n=1 Tax=Venturia canescens TaxID=32260 RepID=UPI001C9CA65E|nr:venom serine protease 34-like [Venturia canescens]